MRTALLAAASAALLVAGCNFVAAPGEKTDAAPEPAAAQTPSAAPLTPNGAPTPLAADTSDENLQWAASVVRLDQIPGESAKLFGTAGGDPAMNGLYTYIAFYPSPAEGWQVYRIGDFLDYTVLSHANGRVDLDVEESTMDEATGNIGSRHRKIIVQWTQGPNDAAPTAVTVTPGE